MTGNPAALAPTVPALARPRWLALLLFAVVFALFLPAVRDDFINYDDNGYVTENAWVQRGLTGAGVRHAFQTTEIAYWHPLTWLSHMADVELFGLNPAGHHFTSILLHALNTALLFLVLRRLTGATGRSAVVAALFGLHPLHVESVAWVAERKDVLSTFFLLLVLHSYAVWAQARAAGRPRPAFYFLALLAFAAGLMSKPMVVTLPCVLLVLDAWPLNRWGPHTADVTARTLGRLVLEKLPFFLLAGAASFAAVVAQVRLGTVQSVAALPPADRMANALVAYGSYLGKCFWPARLAIFYPYPASPPFGAAVAAGLLLAVVTVLAIRRRRTQPYLLAGWLLFLGTLVPVIGFVQVGAQAMADRYSYVPLVGIFIMLVWGVDDLIRRRPDLRRHMHAPGLLVGLLLALATWRQLGYWRDSLTVFRHALAVTGDNWAAHNGLGYYFAAHPGHDAEAIAEYRAMLGTAPGSAEGHYSLGVVLARAPATRAEAADEYRRALALNPRYAQASFALGEALRQLPGQTTEAIAAYRAAVASDPANASAWNELGDLLAAQPERLGEAVAAYQQALRLRPEWVETRNNLGLALAQLPGRVPDAIAEYRRVLAIRPDSARTHNNLANAFVRLERWDDAIAEYRAALHFQPDYDMAELNLGVVLSSLRGHEPEAIVHLENALRLNPNLTPARETLEQLRTVERK